MVEGVRLAEGFHIEGMRQPGGLSGFERRNAFAVELALAFHRFSHFPKPGFAQLFFEIAKVKRCPMLAIAKDKVGKSATDGSKMAWKGIVEPIAPLLLISGNGALQVGDDQPHSSSRL